MHPLNTQLPTSRAALASIAGQHHRRTWRNNQDAAMVTAGPRVWCGVVCDGCGSSAHSELGARLQAQAACEWARLVLPRDPDGDAQSWARSCTAHVLQRLRAVVPSSGGVDFIRDHLLATLLVAVVTPERAAVFGVGDGVVSVDGAVNIIEPNAGNAPDYLAYQLLPQRHSAYAEVSATPHLDAVPDAVQQLWLGTDGAAALLNSDDVVLPDGRLRGGLRAWSDAGDKVWRNASVLQKRLRRLAQNHLLDDDTSLVGWCRQPPPSSGGRS